jgi:hypothetical protein
MSLAAIENLIRHNHYKLEGTKIVPCSLNEWSKFLSSNNRSLGNDSDHGITVSTVFLGLDHNFSKEGPPILFESMSFGADEEDCERYDTYQNAMIGHRILCAKYNIVPKIVVDKITTTVKVYRPTKLILRR